MIDKLVLGTVQLGLDYGINNTSGKPSLETSFNILRTAFDNGIRFLDTAEAYGDSQKVIGKFLKENPGRRFKIITKLSADHCLKEEDFLAHIKTNCKILGIDQLYGYMFHNYQSFKKSLYLQDQLLIAKKEGIVEKVGISLYENDEIEDTIKNYRYFDFIQVPFNVFDNAHMRKAVLKKAKAEGIEVHTRSVFLQGLFFKKVNNLSSELKALKPYLATLCDLRIKNNVDTQTFALQYVLQKEYIDHVLIGVEDVNQLINNLEVCKKGSYIPHNEIDAIKIKEKALLNPSNWN